MKDGYIKHLTTMDLSGLCFRIIFLLNLGSYNQSSISILLNTDRQTINKAFKKLEELGLIEHSRTEGKNKFYIAVTDTKKLKTNIPGQEKLF
ncbi:MAG: winged helix-turn-helix domain-containing protein [Clostridium sp.]